MQKIAAVLPLYWSLKVARAALLTGANLAAVGPDLAIALGIAAVLLLIAYVNVHRAEALAKERGSLVLY